MFPLPPYNFNTPLRAQSSADVFSATTRHQYSPAGSLLNISWASPITPADSRHPDTPCTPTRLNKRKYKENIPSTLPSLSSDSSPQNKSRKYTRRRDEDEKLADIFRTISEAHWTFAEFLYYAFRLEDTSLTPVRRRSQHVAYVQHFLRGHCNTYTPALALRDWLRCADGRIAEDSSDWKLMYSTKILYTDIKPVRAALTSFAVQTVEKRLAYEAECAVHPSNGMHASRQATSTTHEYYVYF